MLKVLLKLNQPKFSLTKNRYIRAISYRSSGLYCYQCGKSFMDMIKK